MYKVLICDDEELEIKSLMATVDWAENGYEICGEAHDGPSALEAIRQYKPQLVFTDICMPGMSGLELIKKAQSRSAQTLFVVISGYAEFAYVQKAVNCGAVGYCLKPFEDSEIEEVLGTARRHIEAESVSLEAELLSRLSAGRPENAGPIADTLAALGLEWNGTVGVTALVAQGDAVENLLSAAPHIRLRLHRGRSAWLVSPEKSRGVIQQIRNDRRMSRLCVGVSEPCRRLDRLYACLSEASAAAGQSFMTGKGGVYFARDTKHADMETILCRLQTVMENKNEEPCLRFFDYVARCFESGGYGILDAYRLYNMILSMSRSLRGGQYGLIDGPESLAETFGNVGEMLRYLKKLAVGQMAVPPSAGVRAKNQTFCGIARYINENFQYGVLSLQTIAQKFAINPNYVSQLFKKEAGVTFTEYLAGLRLNHAIRLLLDTDLPVCAIAEQSGFSDYFYFARVFKKNTGKSPTAYRHRFRNRVDFHVKPEPLMAINGGDPPPDRRVMCYSVGAAKSAALPTGR